MITKYHCFIILLFWCEGIFAQATLTGKVINADTNEPLVAASVYLNNTSIGVSSNRDGSFKLMGIPYGKFKLIVSYVGYETFVTLINFNQIPDELTIRLKPKVNQLSEVVLEPYEKNGWEKWGKSFTDIFIGTSVYARDCTIKNPEVIKFRLSKTQNKFYAFADEPLIIINKALGYEIKYTMEDFEFDLIKQVLLSSGYPLFRDLSIDYPKKAKKWQDVRETIYKGSLMHFMRAFFNNNIEQEGYEIRKLSYIPNQLKLKAVKIFNKNKDTVIEKILDTSYEYSSSEHIPIFHAEDSTKIYRDALKQPDSIISRELIRAKDIGFAIDSNTVGMYCKDSLEVSYRLNDGSIEYKYKRPSSKYKKKNISVSQFFFINKAPISILKDGSYYGPNIFDLKITGFWAWWEMLSTMLPYDYLPPETE